MGQVLGRLLLIRIVTSASPRIAVNLCGIRTRSFNLSAEEIDVTLPDCGNPGGPVQRRTRPGTVQRSFSGSGLFVSNDVSTLLLDHVRNATTFQADVVVPNDGTYSGEWMVSNFEFSGEMTDDLAFSAAFSAAGTLTYTRQASVPINIQLPSVSGIARVGETLTAMPGAWSDSPVFTWQWMADGAEIVGATDRSLLVETAFVGSALSVAVTATTSSGATTVESGATTAVVA